MKSLFESITELNFEDDFELHFQILNLSKGWKLISKLECDRVTLNKLVRYVAYAYSYDSKLLRKKKDRNENKMNIISVLEIDCDTYVLECVQNKNSDFNRYVSWYLRESADREFAIIISAEDLLFDLLETSRDGVEKVVTAKDEKQAEKVMRSFTKMEVILKAEAYDRAMKIKSSIESQTKSIEKNYDYLKGVVRDEGIEMPDNLNWAEKMVIRSRGKN